MTKNSLTKSEQLVEAAPKPTAPLPTEEAEQQKGDNPDTQIPRITAGQKAEELQRLDKLELQNTATADRI